MIAVDTNVLVRLIVADDPVQGAQAAALFAKAPKVFVAKTVLLETAWVLQSGYGFGREQVADALRRLAGLANVVIEDPGQLAFALALTGRGIDIADALHLAACPEAEGFHTFDRRLPRQAEGTGIAVREPGEPAP
jgi:predicted nucleic-acid-binding protein